MNSAGTFPVWRSMLFVPATNERFLAGALRHGADAIQLDLEDSIPATQKDEAREAVATAAARLAGQGADIIVRINHQLRLAIPDVEASIGPDVYALNVPKVSEPGQLRALDDLVTELERERGIAEGRTRLIAMIETAEGLANAYDIAHATPRLVALTVGAEDLAADMGMQVDEDALYEPNMRVLTAARAAGRLPIGYLGSVAAYDDLDAFRRVVRRSAALGFAGGFCIHPSQVSILNTEFSPRPDDVAFAMSVVAAYDQAIKEGKGAVALGKRMIDLPVAERAHQLIRRNELIALREAGKVQ